MVKEEETITEAAGGAGGRGYMDLLGEDYYLCMSPSSYFSTASSTTTTTNGLTSTALLSFHGQEHHDSFDCFQYHGSHAPMVVPQKSSPTTECSSSISSMSSPTATVSSSKPHTKKKGRGGDQKKATASAAAAKKPRATASTTATTTTTASGTIKVRKERLGERILALQQLVSPFGKSDTASVLHEALGYIRFLHDQVQALSSPYMLRLPSSAHAPAQDLRSRGLCLVPVSCTEHVAGNGNGADLWSAAAAAAAAAGKNVCATAFRNDI